MANWQNILVALGDFESSFKALHYVGAVASSLPRPCICLLHIYPEPPPNFYQNNGQLELYQQEQQADAQSIFEQSVELLTSLGVPRDRLYCTTHMAEGKTISETILAAREMGDFGTVVVGKRGVSKAEEFVFGSISNSLARNCRDFAIWIVG